MTADSDIPVVAVLGSVNMDLVTTTRRRPEPGETLLGTDFTTVAGGKGANQAIAARRCGADVRFLGAVGADTFGVELTAALRDSSLDVKLLRSEPGPSGVASIVVDEAGENSIIVVAGANSRMTELSRAELDAIAEADILLCQLEIPLETVAVAARHARHNSTTVVLNPSPVQRLPADMWTNIDVAVVNSGEHEKLGSDLDMVDHVVITRGGDGAEYRGRDGARLSRPSPKITVVDTTGAGDAFTGALAATWHKGPEFAMSWAVAAGSLATTTLGASSSLPTESAVAELLRRERDT
ncbi:ribokinase [Nocardia callitridis]|uniref:Ribokinase n=1 Tax=Nocardia callitridis TaxID=648753 RepID=A0ABP9L3R4_9NOCA